LYSNPHHVTQKQTTSGQTSANVAFQYTSYGIWPDRLTQMIDLLMDDIANKQL